MDKKILNLAGTSVVTGSFTADATYGTGIGYGRASKAVASILFYRDTASSMTGVRYQMQVAKDATSQWCIVPCRLRSDPNKTLAAYQTLSTAVTTTAEDAIISEDVDSSGLFRIVVEAVGATGDALDVVSASVPV